MEGFSEDDIKDYRRTFDLFDEEGRGVISTDNLAVVLRAQYLDLTDKAIQDVISGIGDNEVTFSTLMDVAGNLLKGKDVVRKRDILEAFKKLDKQNCGYIETDQLRNALVNLGEPLSESEAAVVIAMGAMGAMGGNERVKYIDIVDKMYPYTVIEAEVPKQSTGEDPTTQDVCVVSTESTRSNRGIRRNRDK